MLLFQIKNNYIIKKEVIIKTKYIAFVGRSNSGKTTVIKNILEIWKNIIPDISVIKHIHKKGWTIDSSGKDTSEFASRGAKLVIAKSLSETSFIFKKEFTFQEIVNYLDILSPTVTIIEGQDVNPLIPKVICIKNKSEIKDFLGPTVVGITGKGSDELDDSFSFDTEYGNLIVPVFKGKNSFKSLVKHIESKMFPLLPGMENCGHCGENNCSAMAHKIVIGKRNYRDCEVANYNKISVKINGTPVKMKSFVQNMIYESLAGQLRALNSINPGKVVMEFELN